MFEAFLGRFIKIRERAEEESIDPNTFSSAYLSLSLNERGELFSSTLSVWGFAYDWEILRSMVAHVDQSDTEYKLGIKLVRKQGLLLSSAYQYLDRRHTVPKNHYKLMKKLGKLNDPISDAEYEVRRASAIEEIDTYGSLDNMDFVLESDRRYSAFVLAQSQSLRQAFSNESMPREKFHQARKDFRGLMNLMEMRAVYQGTEAAYLDFRNWLVINKQLGEIKDMTETMKAGDREVYAKLQISLDPPLRALVLRQLAQDA